MENILKYSYNLLLYFKIRLQALSKFTLRTDFKLPYTPALATCQPRCECPETIPLSPSIIHMSDEELGCPGNYRQGIIAQWAKFQGNLQKH